MGKGKKRVFSGLLLPPALITLDSLIILREHCRG